MTDQEAIDRRILVKRNLYILNSLHQDISFCLEDKIGRLDTITFTKYLDKLFRVHQVHFKMFLVSKPFSTVGGLIDICTDAIELAKPQLKPIRKTVYISGKISGLPIEQAIAKFKASQKYFEAIGYNVINPMELPDDHDKSWGAYMEVCLNVLEKADVIYFHKDWSDSKGARVERSMAHDLNLDTIYEK